MASPGVFDCGSGLRELRHMQCQPECRAAASYDFGHTVAAFFRRRSDVSLATSFVIGASAGGVGAPVVDGRDAAVVHVDDQEGDGGRAVAAPSAGAVRELPEETHAPRLATRFRRRWRR